MNTKSIQNYNPTFNAKLNITPKSIYNIHTYVHEIEDLPLNNVQLKLLTSKFEKATKGIKGTLDLYFGEFSSFNQYVHNPSKISYINGKYKDSIPVIIEPQALTTKDEFVAKLVKILEIFKFREKNATKIQHMEHRIEELNQSTRASSLGAAETLFKMPDWRNNKWIK